MHALDEVDVSSTDLDDLVGSENPAVEQHVLGDTELFHRERMPRGQIQFEFL
jgi:hypothetical protein